MTMTIRIDAIHVAPVKSLAVSSIERAHVGRSGIDGDRAFFLIDGDGKLLTQREQPRLALVVPTYDVASGELEMRFSDGSVVRGVPVDTMAEVAPSMHGYRNQPGVVTGVRFGEALTAFIGSSVQLVRATGQAFDALPLSICSRASLAALATVAGASVDDRRFRQNIWLSGARAHEEDEWLEHDVRIGPTAVARMIMRDSRCIMTTQNPASGDRDLDTLKLIASYRTDQPKEVNFGVYAGVVAAGDIAVGDEVASLGVVAR